MDFSPYQLQICTDLATTGWTIIDDFLPAEVIEQLINECHTSEQWNAWREAGVGRAAQRTTNKLLRGDKIHWLEYGLSPSSDAYLDCMTSLRLLLNEHLFLGLESNENHLAMYPADTFYRHHLDRFHDNDSRTISSVFYLNNAWKPEHGGELRLHLTNPPNGQHFEQLSEKIHDVAPIANRMVLFVSADIWHEVLTTNVPRWSLTGWFKRRN